ncbi:cell division control protein 14, SIN component-domain-containing protein [Polychytrium aggregatum]|uniref:cell division control protein 14, SIN component-domain-containing protein n=1 Tax=Polychytrium aggregatum TaxID=110093 RepID=UPI0022FE35C8|nr:cell division control protein 14, SIN component-domain-containing protein [Polychytrium aggregatum]KAI9204395.1 cell division control protein 14, SIN component-domain-containing protein [Polychytrium aggregatum]
MASLSESLAQWQYVEDFRSTVASRLRDISSMYDSKHPKLKLDALRDLRSYLSSDLPDALVLLKTVDDESVTSLLQKLCVRLGKLTESRETILHLEVIQGLALLFPQSGKCFSVPVHMEALLKHLTSRSEEILIHVLETLQAVIIGSCENWKRFEQADGIGRICSVLKSRGAKRTPVLLNKYIEVFYIYLSSNKSGSSLDDRTKVLSHHMGDAWVSQMVKILHLPESIEGSSLLPAD